MKLQKIFFDVNIFELQRDVRKNELHNLLLTGYKTKEIGQVINLSKIFFYINIYLFLIFI